LNRSGTEQGWLTVAADAHIAIGRDGDIIDARQKGRDLATLAGFAGTDLTIIATAISEIARNIVVYAGSGEIDISVIEREGRSGLVVTARDSGPGIANIDDAMRDGFSTGKSLGLGLPGARRLMDEFEISSALGQGTTITMRKWKK
jgi:serine/threonine-protein kinase RsbT